MADLKIETVALDGETRVEMQMTGIHLLTPDEARAIAVSLCRAAHWAEFSDRLRKFLAIYGGINPDEAAVVVADLQAYTEAHERPIMERRLGAALRSHSR